MSFKFNERTFLKAVSKMGNDVGRTTDVFLLWPLACQTQGTCMHVHAHSVHAIFNGYLMMSQR